VRCHSARKDSFVGDDRKASAAPPKNPSGTVQINHAIIDERGLIYANDRFTGGLYILRYTGTVPLD
jgi:hypothetical protein